VFYNVPRVVLGVMTLDHENGVNTNIGWSVEVVGLTKTGNIKLLL
jgi:hypothetical protein